MNNSRLRWKYQLSCGPLLKALIAGSFLFAVSSVAIVFFALEGERLSILVIFALVSIACVPAGIDEVSRKIYVSEDSIRVESFFRAPIEFSWHELSKAGPLEGILSRPEGSHMAIRTPGRKVITISSSMLNYAEASDLILAKLNEFSNLKPVFESQSEQRRGLTGLSAVIAAILIVAVISILVFLASYYVTRYLR